MQLENRIAVRTGELEKSNEELIAEISEHRKTATIVSQVKGEWEATVDAVSDWIVITDAEDKIVRCDRAAIQALETSFEDLAGKSIDAIFFRGTNTGLHRKNIEAALRHSIDLVIPFASDLFIEAINNGRPWMLSKPNDKVSEMLEWFAVQISKPEHRSDAPAVPARAKR